MARVIVAEDDRDMSDLIAAALRCKGHDVAEVRSGAELLHAVRSAGAFDLIVSDVRMPVMSGVEALERLRSGEDETPALMLTAFCDEQLRRRIEALSASLLEKPFDTTALCDAVETMLRHAILTCTGP